jgi:hypothetical protein
LHACERRPVSFIALLGRGSAGTRVLPETDDGASREAQLRGNARPVIDSLVADADLFGWRQRFKGKPVATKLDATPTGVAVECAEPLEKGSDFQTAQGDAYEKEREWVNRKRGSVAGAHVGEDRGCAAGVRQKIVLRKATVEIRDQIEGALRLGGQHLVSGTLKILRQISPKGGNRSSLQAA